MDEQAYSNSAISADKVKPGSSYSALDKADNHQAEGVNVLFVGGNARWMRVLDIPVGSAIATWMNDSTNFLQPGT